MTFISSLFTGIPDVENPADFAECWTAWEPNARPRFLDWARDNIVNEDGRPYDHAAYPHLGAPGGPCDAVDDPNTRTIALQFASRCGKSFFGQCHTIYTADVNAAPQMFASSTEKLALEVCSRTYKMVRARPRLNRMLVKNEKNQRQDQIEFRGSLVYVGWARSVSTLADKNAKAGHANEIDKWEQTSTSKEGDPLDLFGDRFKDFQSVRKVVYESTPAVRDRSRIEALRLAATNCKLQVPCPHCRGYQVLEMGNGQGHGLRYDQPEGRRDPHQARSTAYYSCRHCKGRIDDHSRPWMMRRGVWCPEGATVDDKKALRAAEATLEGRDTRDWKGWKTADWIKGNPARDGAAASYQLSSLYALSLRWGDIAEKWVEAQGKPQKLRNFINQWLGETWAVTKSKSTPEKVAERIGSQSPSGIVPIGGLFLTVSADRQRAEGGFVVWTVLAHGREDRAWKVACGHCHTLAELWEKVISIEYLHADGGPPLKPVAAVIDSGWDTKATYDFCAAHADPPCLPCKGSSNDLGGEPYRFAVLGQGGSKRTRTDADGTTLFHVNTDYWETDLQHRLDEGLANQPGSLTLCREATVNLGLIAELLNGVIADGIDARGNAKLLWVKKDENLPNDMRDATRYGLCLGRAWLDDRDGVYPVRGGVISQKPASTVICPGERRPDGRPWN